MAKVLILLFAGWGAGIVTGFAGASAVVVIVPLLTSFLDYNPYTAIGISLASDVVASSMSAYMYKKKGNIDIRDGLNLAFVTVVTALVGSWLSHFLPAAALGSSTGFVILLIGLSFIRKPLNQRLEDFKKKRDLSFWQERRLLASLVFGGLIGLLTGTVGAGGGMMILIVLTFILGYPVHKAVGTSVLIMAFNALSGAISHFVVEGAVPLSEVVLTSVGALLGAIMAANYANAVSEQKLSKIIGYAFILLGILSVIQ